VVEATRVSPEKIVRVQAIARARVIVEKRIVPLRVTARARISAEAARGGRATALAVIAPNPPTAVALLAAAIEVGAILP
jgi:hypothetical protein